jgi:SAM-dependent methyltransferase
MSNDFVFPKLSISNMGIHYVRKSIFDSLRSNLDNLSGTLLDVGCGQMPYRKFVLDSGLVSSYIGLDLEDNPIHVNKPDLLWDGKNIPLDDNSVDSVLITEVIEHVPDLIVLLKEIHRVLKPGGKVVGTCPFLFPLHEAPYDFYRYTPFALNRFFLLANFSDIKIQALGGWDASMALMLGLWLKQSNLIFPIRMLLTIFLFPLYILLLWSEKRRHSFDVSKGPMFTGLSFCISKK